jgi:glycosyltransferase involved in cell wall biosynthesis
MSTAAIVIPCFNEAKRLDRAAFEQFSSENPDVSLVFVDDGSRDDTRRILEELAARLPDRASVVALEENSGKAEAVRRGIHHALEHQPSSLERQPNYVGFWDADLATPLDAIGKFSDLLDANPQLQMIMGARVQLLGRHIERSPLRHYAGRVAATAISMVLGLRVYDTQCGAKLFRSDAARDLFSEPFRTRWIFDAEIIARLIARPAAHSDPAAGDLIYEYPLHAWLDVRGSKVGPGDYLRAAVDLHRIYQHYVRPRRRG